MSDGDDIEIEVIQAVSAALSRLPDYVAWNRVIHYFVQRARDGLSNEKDGLQLKMRQLDLKIAEAIGTPVAQESDDVKSIRETITPIVDLNPPAPRVVKGENY